MSPSGSRTSALIAWCIAGRPVGPSYLLRARFLLLGAAAVSVSALFVAALYAASPDTSWGLVAGVLALAAPGPLVPLLLRRGVGLPLLGGAFVVVLQVVLAVSAFADRGLDDVALFWLIVSPLMAAFVGGRHVGWVTAATAGLMGLALLAAAEAGYVFPDHMDPVFARRYHVANVVLAGLFVAGLAWLYEGPFVRRLQELSRSRREANERLRRELAARRRAQAAAEAASRAKDVLLANMSHEFRTPLTAILSGSEILIEEASADDRAVLESVQRGAERLLRTLEGVLEYAWHESAEGALTCAPLPLKAAVAEAVAPATAAAARKGLAVEVRADDVWAVADPAAARRVVGALADNAVRFTEAGGVRVTVRDAGAWAVVEVTDTGVGMSEAFLPHATDPFRQASEGDGRTHEGVGLGLTLARCLVTQMGGHLAVESAEGRGTTVRVRLPAVAAGDGAAATPEETPGVRLGALQLA